jgi:predicted TPR repeat methyltransferase
MAKPRRKGKKKSGAKPPKRLSMDQMIRFAVELQQRSSLDEAEILYKKVLAVAPEHPDALHFFGVLQYQRGRSEEAIHLIRQSLQIAPEYTDAHNNLGNIYRELDRLSDAESCYRRGIELNPEHAGAYNNLGTVLLAKGAVSDAEAAYQKAIALDPNAFSPYENMGNLLSRQGKGREAVAHYSQAIVLNPNHPGSKRMLGIALSCMGRLDEAAAVFREWAKKEPDNPVARHLLAACSREKVPERASDEYVKQVFDNFSGHFEERLEHLEYRAPKLIGGAVAVAHGKPTGNLVILDAGCGTGLCGPRLRPFAGRLEGVDLSPGMLKRAESTGCYDLLVEAELTDFIGSRKSAYDMIVSADTLCYFGNLSKVMSTAAAALRPGGRFIFTVERASDGLENTTVESYHLNPQGRYSHREKYVRSIVSEAGLKLESIVNAALRKEMGSPVEGLVVTTVAGDAATSDPAVSQQLNNSFSQ